MSDLSITMHGDASGAAGAMREVAHEAGALHEVLEGALKGALGSTVGALTSWEAAGEKVVDILKDSIKEAANAQAAHRQLAFAAGELTEQFEAQAKAIAETFAVRDEDVEHLQTMLLRYGAAPSVIGDAVQAVENFAAATGQDANSAMMMLVRGVESGTGSLGRMGVHFKATGDFAKDMASAVEALNDRFGGAGETAAGGLEGRLRAASIAMEDLRKAMGGFFATIEEKTHILEGFTEYIKRISEAKSLSEGIVAALSTYSESGDYETWGEKSDINGVIGNQTVHLGPGGKVTVGEASPFDGAEKGKRGGKNADVKAIEQKMRDDERLAQQEEHNKKWIREEEEFEAKQTEIAREAAVKRADDSSKDLQEQLRQQADADKKELDELNKLHEAEEAAEEKKNKEVERLREKADAEQQQKFKKQEQMWHDAGDRMGAALVDALGRQLQRLAEGGDVDPAEMAGDVVSTILGIAGAAIGTVYGMPQLGGAIGGLAGSLAKTGITSAFGRKHHDGGWIERYHSGGWMGLGPDEVPFIGKRGERVLSERQVSNMGGPAAVDAAARGGRAGPTVYISALDTQSFTDSMGREGGRGVFDAIRVGRGDLVPLFSRG